MSSRCPSKRALVLWLALAVFVASGCKTRLGIASLDEAFAREVDLRRITLEGRRTHVDMRTPPVKPPAIWYLMSSEDEPRFDAQSATAEFVLSFLAENESDTSWTLRQHDFGLTYVGGARGVVDRTLTRQGRDADERADLGGDDVLLTLPPGGAATVRVPFAVTACADLTRRELLGTIYELEVRDPRGEPLLRRRIELGEWDQIWQGTRAALLATLVFLLWGALG